MDLTQEQREKVATFTRQYLKAQRLSYVKLAATCNRLEPSYISMVERALEVPEFVYVELASVLGYNSVESMLAADISFNIEACLEEIHELVADDPVLQKSELDTLEAALVKLKQPLPNINRAIQILESAIKIESEGYVIGYALTNCQVTQLLTFLRPFVER